MNRTLGTIAAACLCLGATTGARAQDSVNAFGAYPTPNNVPAPYVGNAPMTNYGIAAGYNYGAYRPYVAGSAGYVPGGYTSFYSAPGYGTMGYGAASYGVGGYPNAAYGYSTYTYPTYRYRRGIFGWRNRGW